MPAAERMVLLGTGTCQLQGHRMASSVLLELGDLRIVFDFGRGVSGRLAGLGLRQDDVRHVVLSHFHPDHLSDLVPYLHAACWSREDPRTADLHIWGPPGLEVQLMRLLSLFDADTLVRRDRFAVHLHEVGAGPFTVEGRELLFADLPPAGNHGLKLRHGARTCALTGDSSFHEQEVQFLAGADLAVIDAGHLEDEEILALAAAAQPDLLVCSHLYCELDEADLADRARRRGFRGRLVVGEDLMDFPL